jgi:ABC-2 type transport system permease protein
MNRALVMQLIWKDWYLSRATLVLGGVAGLLAVSLLYLRTEVSGFIGLSSAIIVLVLVSIFLPMNTMVGERKKQNVAFVMSLPISPMEYTAAKILANLSGFLIVWLVVTAAVIGTFAGTPLAGLIPLALIIALVPFIAFSVMLGVAIVVDSEFWAILTMGAFNISYSFLWYFLIRIPGIGENLRSPVPVWSEAVQWLLAGEILAIVLAFALTIFFQAKKKSFI